MIATVGDTLTHVYGPGDHRIWQVDHTTSTWDESWTIRDLSGNVVRRLDKESQTGVRGLNDLVQGGIIFRSLHNFNDQPHLPRSMHGMSFDEALSFALNSGASEDCSANSHCAMLAEVAKALENPLFRSISGAQQTGLTLVLGTSAATGTGRAVSASSRAAVNSTTHRLFGRGALLNSNRYFRIGYGRRGGERVFRISGQWVKTVARKNHIDLWTVGPL